MEDIVRVLHVVVNMNRGGAETLIMNLYRNIDRSKVQFDFLTCKEGVFDKEILELGGKIHRIPYISDVGHFGYTRALNEFFNMHYEYKIVHSHLDKMSGLVLRAAKKAGIPVRIAHSHNTSSEGGRAARIYKNYASSFIKSSANSLLACSNAAATWLFDNRSNQAKILNNGIEFNKFSYKPSIRKEIREHLKVDDNTVVLGHVGRFFEQKNHEFIIEVFKEFNHKEPNSILVLVGDGELKKKIEKKVHDYGLDNKVRFLGIRSDVEKVVQAFDLFIFPSFHEGLPVTLVEVQASGLPCLISENITKDVDLGLGLIDYLPINDVSTWVNKITNFSFNNNRKISKRIFIEKGYDIEKTASFIQEYYLKVSG
ncbi:glycosyltransferase family 1 protein [Neobacillus drentensis]|uniref:glycosyltransferase family 1 protein n=1 Tax=Neobacillus drentensis TaxID=220684 RepID=UPI003002E95B